jgi:hypothetical protein
MIGWSCGGVVADMAGGIAIAPAHICHTKGVATFNLEGNVDVSTRGSKRRRASYLVSMPRDEPAVGILDLHLHQRHVIATQGKAGGTRAARAPDGDD